jgi:succinate dehydrogenase/fumarate reductase flavoprotein subunit
MRAEFIDADVLVIGGGAAGCAAALRAHELGAKVLVVVKGKMGRSGATPLASAIGGPLPQFLPLALLKPLTKIFAAVADKIPVPVPGRYRTVMTKMAAPHHWLVDQDYFVNFGMWALEKFFPALEAKGLYVLRDESGMPAIPVGWPLYVLQSHGMTGYQFGEFRRKEVLSAGIEVLEEATAFRLLHDADGAIAGACVLDYKTGRLHAVRAKATILATGHTNWLATRATGTREMAANGLAMAARAGAELCNLEIQWFHGSDMASPASWMRLHHYPNYLNGTDRRAVMVNSAGEEYMRIEDYNVNMPYTIQVKKLYEQVKAGKASWDRGSFTDFGRVPRELLQKYQYHWEFYEKIGKDMGRDRHEGGITWHMSAGGVRANIETMETGVRGLFIAGAVGGHMLGALTFATYDGEIAGSHAARFARARGLPSLNGRDVRDGETRIGALLAAAGGGGVSPIAAKLRIREVVWSSMMFRKDARTLERGLTELAAVRAELLPKLRLRTASSRYNTDLVDALDVEDMLDVCEMTARASLLREESRGPHFREDFPFTDNDRWLKQIVVTRRDGRVDLRFEPVRQKYVRPQKGRIDYFRDPYA